MGGGLIATVNCSSQEIILDNSSPPPFSGAFTATLPNGTTYPMSGSFPISIGGVGVIQDGIWTFTDDSNEFTPISVVVNCGGGGGGGNGGGVTGCDAIAGVYDCIFKLNERYEELECVNDKRAQKEKIKLDRVMQLFQLAEFDCECGMNDINEYIREIESIANCDDCVKPISIIPKDTYGCTDPTAFNYNSFSTIDDGSCLYSQSCLETTMADGTVKSETLIPDPYFEAWLENQGYGNGALDGKVCSANLVEVCGSVDIDGSPLASSITDLTGIEDFENIGGPTPSGLTCNAYNSYFQVGNTSITTLNLSNASPNVGRIYANFCKSLVSANFSNLSSNLFQIQMQGCNSLSSLNVSGCTYVSFLQFGGTPGTSYVSEINSPITSVDLSTLTALTGLHIRYTNLITLDLGSVIDLNNLDIDVRDNDANLVIKVGTAPRVTLAQTLFTVANESIDAGTTFTT